MAAEIRDLEDQLYEYDHQYRLLEQEIESLQQQNASLQSTVNSAGQSPKRSLLSPGLLSPRDSSRPEFEPLPIPADPMLRGAPGANDRTPPGPGSVLERDTPLPTPGVNANQSDELPSPQIKRATPPEASSPNAGQVAPPGLPGANSPSLRTPNASPIAPPSNSELPKLLQPKGSGEFKEEELGPPSIELGDPMPPPLPVVTQLDNGTSLAPEDSLELNLSRVELPQSKTPAKLASNSSINQATLQIAKEKVTDMRVVELTFHPTLSRAINMDDRPDDDGLYLVIQPKNERGQMVPVSADLTIFALDPAREADKARIGRWDYSAADVEAKLQPIGAEQGIHFRLPWNGPDPSADRVIVFALFKFENGRQVMGEKEIFISSDGSHKTVWTPRSSGGEPRGQALPPVATAGYQMPAEPRRTNSAALPSTPVVEAGHVVRPTNGSATREPAPAPNAR